MTTKLTTAYLGIIIAALIFVALIVAFAPPVQAATVPPCEAINTADVITIYRCVPDEGASFLLNSYGFMVVEE